MSQNSPIVRRMSLPLIPMGGVVAFPALPVDFELNDPLSLAALEAAKSMDSFVLLLPLLLLRAILLCLCRRARGGGLLGYRLLFLLRAVVKGASAALLFIRLFVFFLLHCVLTPGKKADLSPWVSGC